MFRSAPTPTPRADLAHLANRCTRCDLHHVGLLETPPGLAVCRSGPRWSPAFQPTRPHPAADCTAQPDALPHKRAHHSRHAISRSDCSTCGFYCSTLPPLTTPNPRARQGALSSPAFRTGMRTQRLLLPLFEDTSSRRAIHASSTATPAHIHPSHAHLGDRLDESEHCLLFVFYSGQSSKKKEAVFFFWSERIRTPRPFPRFCYSAFSTHCTAQVGVGAATRAMSVAAMEALAEHHAMRWTRCAATSMPCDDRPVRA